MQLTKLNPLIHSFYRSLIHLFIHLVHNVWLNKVQELVGISLSISALFLTTRYQDIYQCQSMSINI